MYLLRKDFTCRLLSTVPQLLKTALHAGMQGASLHGATFSSDLTQS